MKYAFPKIDLHNHLDGGVLPETAWELAKERGIALPADNLEAFRHFITVTADCRSVNEYLKRFEIPLQILQDKPAITRVTKDLLLLLASQGLAYAEVRFAPQFHLRGSLTQADAIDAVLTGRAQALAEAPDFYCNIIVCMMATGDEKENHAENEETVRLAAKYLGKGVCATDLAGIEGLCPLSAYADLFALARALGVPYTCHAGDSVGPDTVEEAMDMGARRIGHGHHIFDDKALCERAIREGVTLEVCPTSNIQCQSQPSYEEHPLKKLYEMGMKVTINTDNMILSGVCLDHEYDLCIEKMGFTERDIIKMNSNSANAAFLDDTRKKALIEKLNAYL